MILIQQYFYSENQERQKEINQTLQKNIENPLIKEIHLLNESIYNLKYPKTKEFNIGKRLNYTLAIKHALSLKDEIVIISNNDIYFDDSLKIIKDWKDEWNNKVICLTRYELDKYNNPIDQSKSEVFYYKNIMMNVEPKWSHDSWIFKSNQMQSIKCDFHLGTLGCEGAFACAIRNKNLDIINGYPYIKAIHNHKSMHRTYDPKHQIHSVESCTKIKYDIFGNEIKTIRNISNLNSDKNKNSIEARLGLTLKNGKLVPL